MIKLFNTLNHKKEIFKSLYPKKVGLYNCGPTVYDFVHIGNLRAYVFADILRRALEFDGYKVKQIINITDVGHLSSDSDSGEDKMVKGLKRENKPITMQAMKELSDNYTEKFKEDLKDLNIKSPFKLPKASKHIKEYVTLIKKLEKKGFTYKTSDGIYFDTSKDKSYGKLGGLVKNSEARIKKNPEKRNERDFALWKFSGNGNDLGFESPFGIGFPGWHLECSAIAMKYLGETFDIHTGGIDHIPVHHNNEIAQSENATGKPLAKFWLHSEFLSSDKNKMAKSAGNFLTLKNIKENNIDPLALRYWFLGVHYRHPLTLNLEALKGAEIALNKIREAVSETKGKGKVSKKYLKQFEKIINDDLDTAKSLALLWKILKDEKTKPTDKKATILKFDEVLGLGLSNYKKTKIPEKIKKLLEQREGARKSKNWSEADRIRVLIEKEGFLIKDTEAGPILHSTLPR